MLAVPIANGNLITLTPVNGLYDPNLPTRLNGIISAEDFRGSIERCNDVYRKNKAYYLLSVVILIGGVLAGLAVFIAGQVTLNFAILFAGLGIFVGSAVIGTCLCGFVGRKMVDGLNQAVQAEHVRYAAPVPGRPPISWSINQPVVMGPNMRWRRGSYEINIEVGKSFQGSPIAMGQQFPYGQGQPIVYSAAYPPQPQYQPYQQSPAQAQVQSQTQAHPPPFQSYAQPPPQLPPPSYEASEPTSTYSADYAAPVKSS